MTTLFYNRLETAISAFFESPCSGTNDKNKRYGVSGDQKNLPRSIREKN